MWGEAPITEQEVFETFALYIEGRIPNLVSYIRHFASRVNRCQLMR